MKAYMFILALITAMHSTASAQPVSPKSIEDSVIGWMKVYNFTGPRTPVTVDAKHYSAAQLSITDSLANWIQASYTPKGALGDVRRTVSRKLGLYNKNDAALPQSYGAVANSYYELKYNSSRKLEPFTASSLKWSIMANGLFGEPVPVLNTPAQYYFLLPGFGNHPAQVNAVAERYNVVDHPSLKRYITYFDDQLRGRAFVMLSKDNKLPFVKISKAEYLDKLAGAVERKHVAEKEYAVRSWPEGNARTSALAEAEDRYGKRLSLLGSNRERYAARLQESAEVFTLQPDALLENYKDVFEGSGAAAERYPVYKLDAVMADLAKTDKPQWIVVQWDGELVPGLLKQHHDAIVNNFDFQYVYDFFFAPEKIGGRPYRPLRSPGNAAERRD